ncbi:hypothetical protein G6F66_014403 [Rhizopus arrhizus]|nr:hypothetical protein G6F34_014099 [Rhizopus arrhizus]KAG1260609.1 hypothetical protein G6F66_014403 [Rhizopus arrhizus]
MKAAKRREERSREGLDHKETLEHIDLNLPRVREWICARSSICRTSLADPTSATSSAYNRLLMGVGDRDEEDKAAVPTKGPKGRPSATRAPGPGGPEGDTDNTEVVVAEAAERSRAGNVLT